MGLVGRLILTCAQAVRQQSRLACHVSVELCHPSCSSRGLATSFQQGAQASLRHSAAQPAPISSHVCSLLARLRAPTHTALLRQAAAQQQQQTRGLFAATPKHKKPPKNWQNHNPKPPSVGRKMKTPSLARRRFYVAEDGTIMRRHTHNRHNKSKRSKSALRRLKGDAPLGKGYAKKLRKLGFKRKFWYARKIR